MARVLGQNLGWVGNYPGEFEADCLLICSEGRFELGFVNFSECGFADVDSPTPFRLTEFPQTYFQSRTLNLCSFCRPIFTGATLVCVFGTIRPEACSTGC